MSKSNDDQLQEEQADLPPADGNAPGSNPGPDNRDKPPEKKEAAKGLTIEEHCQRMQIDKPVFAAVMQAEQWASGKRVSETVFKKAVNDFMGAPMEGRKPPEKKEEK